MPRTKNFRILFAVALFTVLASPVRAELITINAGDYPLGTDLSTLFSGLTMSRLSQAGGNTTFNPGTSPVYTAVDYPVPVPSLGGTYGLFNYQACSAGSIFSCMNGYTLLEFRFDTPTDFFQIDGYFFTDPSDLIAYDALGNLIAGFGTVVTTSGLGIGETTRSTLTLGRDRGDIARVVYGGFRDSTVTPTQVSYNSVPEPSTLAAVGVGLLCAALRRAYRRRSSAAPATGADAGGSV
jgi:hypothetical protein